MPPRKHQYADVIYVYGQQRRDAKKRGIGFYLTFEEWLVLWMKSGQYPNRGCRKGQYVMARFGDNGPYAFWNVEIILCEQNYKDAASKMRGIPKSEEAKRNISKSRIGMKLSASHRKAIGDAQRGKPKKRHY